MTHKMLRLKPSVLKFDHSYQRAPLKAHLGRLVAQFDPSLVGALVVSRREDGDYVIDGQHRALAAVEAGLGEQAVDCVTHLDLTRGEEAALFLRLNRERKAVSRVSEWGAALLSGEPRVLAQAAGIERAGWRVNPLSGANGQISAVSSLARLRRLDPGEERDLTFRTLRLLTDAWGMGKDVGNGHLIEGVGMFVSRFGDSIDLGPLADKLRKAMTEKDILGKARALRGATGGTVAAAVAKTVHATYNSKRTSGRIADW